MLKPTLLLLAGMFGMMNSFGQHTKKGAGMKPMFGLKAGLNFSNAIANGSMTPSRRNGFVSGIYFAPPASSSFGYRTELLFSRQGYDYNASGTMGSITQDYILLPQLTTFTIAKRLQFQLGGQLGFLVNAKNRSISASSSPYPFGEAADYFKKLSFDLVGGAEVFPIKNLLIGGRANLGLNGMTDDTKQGTLPPYVPEEKNRLKSATVHLYIGCRF